MILICGFLKCVLVAGLTKCIPDAHMGFPMNPGCFRWLWSVGVNKWTHYLLKSCMTFYYNDWHLDIENKSYNFSVTFNYLFKNFVAISPPPCIFCFLITSSNIKQHANLGVAKKCIHHWWLLPIFLRCILWHLQIWKYVWNSSCPF